MTSLRFPRGGWSHCLPRFTRTIQNATGRVEFLRGWDARELPESAQAALMEVWISRHLGRAFIDAVLPPNAAGAIEGPDMAVMLDMLEKPGAVPNRDRMLIETLGSAYRRNGKIARSPIPKPGNGASCTIRCRSIPCSTPWTEKRCDAFSPDHSRRLAAPTRRMLRAIE